MERLHVDGYAVLRGFTTITSAAYNTYMQMAADAAEPIFNDNPAEHRNDNRRRQLTLNERTAAGPLVAALRRCLETEFPHHTARDWVLLESRPGCRQQAAHTDYVPIPELTAARDEEVPLLFLLALEDDTRLEVWPRTHRPRRYPVFRTTVGLSAGDAVLFRGDLVHAGSAYERQNLRIHAYLDHPAVPRDPNRTWIIYKHADPVFQSLICEDPWSAKSRGRDQRPPAAPAEVIDIARSA